ncbi:MAG: phosphoadenylyl-sulfate reductase, partial [Rhodobacteraceae bacterium]|nr:phosphoadenylyl-sulfate reductase [Paracoccaceae bacterium]
ILRNVLWEPMIGRVALVSSFGAESVVLLHMLSTIDKNAPVLFIDTELLFPETLDYQQQVADKLGLTNVRVIRASKAAIAAGDPYGRLHMANSDACCALRKTEPLEQTLAPYDAWITGRKRFQAGTRTELKLFETDGDARMKINPLARWRKEDLRDYIENNNLPRHPLVAKGYPSIGCAPCTSRVKPGEDERAGRWRGADKVECGIHFGASGAERAA